MNWSAIELIAKHHFCGNQHCYIITQIEEKSMAVNIENVFSLK